MLVGYSRVSTSSQKLDLQNDALIKNGCEKIFSDVASGAKSERVGLIQALDFLRAGDILVIWKLDRLGRSLKHLIKIVSELEEIGIGFRSLQENIDTTTPTGKLFFHFFGALAEFERTMIIERTKAGLESARARGKKGGRPKKMDRGKIEMAQAMYDKKTIPIKAICEKFEISKVTLYRHLKIDNK
jgi:DNA invertase Pin-like site-specific DNA recombinase